MCEYLAIQERLGRLWFARINNGATYDPRRGLYRAMTGTGYKAGVPDIICCLAPTGRFLALECKSATGTLSEGQNSVKKAVTASGGSYAVVRSVGDVVAVLADSSLHTLAVRQRT